jgi:hypothetical protein
MDQQPGRGGLQPEPAMARGMNSLGSNVRNINVYFIDNYYVNIK